MPTPIVNGAKAALALLAIATSSLTAQSAASAPARTTRAAAGSQVKPAANVKAKPATSTNTPAQGQNDSLYVKADLGRIDGNSAAKVWVVEISDMECPFCKRWHDQVYPKVRDEFIKTGKIRFAYVNFPLNQHKHAFAASTAAMCASVQGKFWQMHDALFTTQAEWEKLSDSGPFFEGLATKAGVNVPTWKSCLNSASIKALIEADRDRAKQAGVESTPSFIIGGKLVDGAMPWDDIKKAINNAIAASK